MPDDPSLPEPSPEEAARSLETALVALQKTFSRVSGRSREVPPDQPRALIVGDVTFELRTRVEKGDADHLLLSEEGEIELTLTGTVRTDVRESVDGRAVPPNPEPPTTDS